MVHHNRWSYVNQESKNNFIPLSIEIYDYFNSCFDSFFTTCAHAIIAYHQQSSLILMMLSITCVHIPLTCVSHYKFSTTRRLLSRKYIWLYKTTRDFMVLQIIYKPKWNTRMKKNGNILKLSIKSHPLQSLAHPLANFTL